MNIGKTVASQSVNMSSFRIDDILEAKKNSNDNFGNEAIKSQLNMELIWNCIRAKWAINGEVDQCLLSPMKKAKTQHDSSEELKDNDFPLSSDEEDGNFQQMKFDFAQNSALDALIRMANTTMNKLNTMEPGSQATKTNNIEIDNTLLGLFNKAAHLRKRRKTRTTFSNAQISELENNFSRQKYLTPADRDRIARKLNLSNTQVITWFQNRRAKMKRETEELERDILAAKQGGSLPKCREEELENGSSLTSPHSDGESNSLSGKDSTNSNSDKKMFESDNDHVDNKPNFDNLDPFNKELLNLSKLSTASFGSPNSMTMLPTDILSLGWKLLNMSKSSAECDNSK